MHRLAIWLFLYAVPTLAPPSPAVMPCIGCGGRALHMHALSDPLGSTNNLPVKRCVLVEGVAIRVIEDVALGDGS